jgi:hypothetical protein
MIFYTAARCHERLTSPERVAVTRHLQLCPHLKDGAIFNKA